MNNPWIVSIVGGVIASIIAGIIMSAMRTDYDSGQYGSFISVLVRLCFFGIAMAAITFVILRPECAASFASLGPVAGVIARVLLWFFSLFFGFSLFVLGRNPFNRE